MREAYLRKEFVIGQNSYARGGERLRYVETRIVRFRRPCCLGKGWCMVTTAYLRWNSCDDAAYKFSSRTEHLELGQLLLTESWM